MKISLNIKKLQHIKNGTIELDMGDTNIICIVGKNGVGKTSLIKSINLTKDIKAFEETANEETEILLSIDKNNENTEKLTYFYDEKTKSLDCREVMQSLKLHIELPIPFGARFNGYPQLSKSDSEIRTMYLQGKYDENREIIDFFSKIYPNCNKFKELKELDIRGSKYYILPDGDDRYIREDYFSSGEYFILNIYKTLLSKDKEVIIIDEIDISLDASAQVNLVRELDYLCNKYKKKIIFTSHSLVIMRVLYNELRMPIYYLSNNEGEIKIIKTSYGFVVGEMFGFDEYDKYIIVEDILLEKYIRHLLSSLGDIFEGKKIKTLYIGGAEEVKDFLKGSRVKILNKDKKDVIAIVDGDKKHVKFQDRILHIPFDSVEKELMKKCRGNEKKYNINGILIPPQTITQPKSYYKYLSKKGFENSSVFDIIEEGWDDEIRELKNKVSIFLRT